MNPISTARTARTGRARGQTRPLDTLVWDAPVRVFHWLLALSFAAAYLTSESDRWRVVHVTAGYTMAGLVFFRLIWGMVGTRHARFTDFVRGPRAVVAYLKSLLTRRPEHHTGHNPAGAWAIVALLVLSLLTAASGWASYNELGGHWLEEVHEAFANGMLLVVIAHIAAAFLSSWLHHENLVAAMVHGRKPVSAQEGIRSAWRSVAALLLAGVFGFWWLQWQAAPAGEGLASATPQPAAMARDHDDED